MKIVADGRVAALDTTFGRHGVLVKLAGQDIANRHLRDADALITRTVTRVDRALLEGTPVRFVGTATIGFDHIDTAYLDSAGIAWTNAPGCNADATAQYTLAMYLLACRRLGRDPLSQTYGVIGRGNVGGRLVQLLAALGVSAQANDPPLEAQGEDGLRPLDAILECQVISLHVPLTRHGQWPTHHMINASFLASISSHALLINTSRGDVMDGQAVRTWMAAGGHAALDVWPGEPDVDEELLERAIVASPHVAGYSLDGKRRASAKVYREFCERFGLDTDVNGACPGLPPKPRLRGQALARAIADGTPVEDDDRAMRSLLRLNARQRTDAFQALRSSYSLRRDLTL